MSITLRWSWAALLLLALLCGGSACSDSGGASHQTAPVDTATYRVLRDVSPLVVLLVVDDSRTAVASALRRQLSEAVANSFAEFHGLDPGLWYPVQLTVAVVFTSQLTGGAISEAAVLRTWKADDATISQYEDF